MLFLHSGKKIINVVHYICLKIGQRWLSLHCSTTWFFGLFGFVLSFFALSSSILHFLHTIYVSSKFLVRDELWSYVCNFKHWFVNLLTPHSWGVPDHLVQLQKTQEPHHTEKFPLEVSTKPEIWKHFLKDKTLITLHSALLPRIYPIKNATSPLVFIAL